MNLDREGAEYRGWMKQRNWCVDSLEKNRNDRMDEDGVGLFSFFCSVAIGRLLVIRKREHYSIERTEKSVQMCPWISIKHFQST